MPTSTTNYGLIKPGTDDPILIGQLNDNMDTIDAALKENADAIENKPDAADIPAPSTAAPAMDGTAAAGTSTDYARADHVHPSDTSKQDALTAAQLAAANSGINSEKVAQIEANKNNITTYNTYLVGGATAITANTDLNTLLTPGIYTCTSSDIAATLTNCPYTSSGFRVDVIQTSSANFKKQILQPNQMGTDSSRYERSYSASSNAFSSWYKFEGTAVT